MVRSARVSAATAPAPAAPVGSAEREGGWLLKRHPEQGADRGV